MAAEPPKVRRLVLACFITIVIGSVAAVGEDVQTSSTTLADLLAGIHNAPTLTQDQKIQLSADLTDLVNDGTASVSDLSSLLSLVDLGSVSSQGTGFAVAALEAAFEALSGGLEPATVADALSRALAAGDVGVIRALSRLQDDSSGAAVAIRDSLATSSYDATAVASLTSQIQGLVSQGVPAGILVRLVKQGLRAGLSSFDLTASLAEVGSLITSKHTPPGQAANQVQNQGAFERTHQTRDRHEALGEKPQGSDGAAAHRNQQGHKNKRNSKD